MTGDEVAKVVLDFAAVLGGQGRAATIVVPATDEMHGTVEIELLVGPASQMMAEPIDTDQPELTAPEFVTATHERMASLEHPGWVKGTSVDWDL